MRGALFQQYIPIVKPIRYNAKENTTREHPKVTPPTYLQVLNSLSPDHIQIKPNLRSSIGGFTLRISSDDREYLLSEQIGIDNEE